VAASCGLQKYPGAAIRPRQTHLERLDNIDKHRYLAIHETALDMHFPQLKWTDDVIRDAEISEITLPLELQNGDAVECPAVSMVWGSVREFES
jgi:hypothetical protein